MKHVFIEALSRMSQRDVEFNQRMHRSNFSANQKARAATKTPLAPCPAVQLHIWRCWSRCPALRKSRAICNRDVFFLGIRSSGRDWLLLLHQPTNSKTVLLNESHKVFTSRVSGISKTKDRYRALHCNLSATRTRQTAARYLQTSYTKMFIITLANINILL